MATNSGESGFTSVADLLDTALKYHEHSIQVFPLPLGSKVPSSPWKEYTQRPNTEEDIIESFTERRNIAAVCGTISQNLGSLDFDSMTAFNEHRRKLETLLNETPVFRTGRGVQVLFRTPEPIRTRNHIAPKVDIRGEGSYVVVPPSLHPNGNQYTFWNLWDTITVIDPSSLPFDLEPPRPHEAVSMDGAFIGTPTVRPYGLPVRLWDLLRGGDIGTRYASRSEAEMAIALYCVNNGWDGGEILGLFYMHAGPGTKFREEKAQNAETARKYIESQVAAARAYLQEHRSEVDREIDRFWQHIEAHPWNPRTRYTDKAVAAAILTKARMCGRLEGIGASCREIAEIAGVQWITAQRSTRRIPFIRKESPSVYSLDSSYNPLTVKKWYDCASTPSPLTVKECTPFARSSAFRDVFHRKGLKKTGRAVYEALGEPLALQELLKALEMDARTVKKRLEALVAVGMVEEHGGAYIAVPDVNFDAVAHKLGTRGLTEAQKERHRKDRERFQAWKDKKRAANCEKST